MKRLLAALTLAIAIVASTAPTARACSCIARPFEELARDAHAIFEARVASIEPVPGGELARVRVRLDVVQTWREANTEHVEVLTAADSASCGVTFEVGRSYLVLADRIDGELVASLCGGTTEMASASEQRLTLGSGVIPVDIEDREPEETSSETRPAQAVAPGGGCAGCSVADGGNGGIAWPAGALAWVAIRRRRIRAPQNSSARLG